MKRIGYWQMGGFIFTAIAGTLLHFLFDWSGESPLVALFSAVNESIWEHLKLLFYPMVAVAIVENFFWGKKIPSFWCVKLIGISAGLLLIPILYYTYTGILGINADWFNIAIFFLVAAAVYWMESKLLLQNFSSPLRPKVAVSLLILLAVLFSVLTFSPPHIPLFQDPVTGTYGYHG